MKSLCVLVLSMISSLPIGNDALRAEFVWLAAHARKPQLRSFRQFMEEDFVIPKGRSINTSFQFETQPFMGLLADEIDNARWTEFAITGCVQSGKSTIGFVATSCYFLFEYGEPVILGVPTMKIGKDKWSKEIRPAIMASRYKMLMPLGGSGSRGGFTEEVNFANGAALKFMSGSGGDENRSSYTSRIVIVTEADKMDEAGETSREADPMRQLAARTLSYPEDERRIFAECTVSLPEGRIWKKYNAGTASKIVCQCPHCDEWVTPEREHLMGWQQADSAIEARRQAYYACPSCGDKITQAERIEMNRRAKLIHRGQSIDRAGVITGPVPDTNILGFRWNCFNNQFMSAGDVGEKEWEAVHGDGTASAEKELCQFYWAIPYTTPDFDNTPLDSEEVRRRFTDRRYTKELIPDEAVCTAMHVDLGKRYFHWMLMAWMPGFRGIISDYGTFEVPWKTERDGKQINEERAIFLALCEFRDEMVLGKEWLTPLGVVRRPQRILVDCAWHPDAVAEFMRDKATDRRWLPAIGYGQSQSDRYKYYREPSKKNAEVKLIGEQYHVVWSPKYKFFRIDCNADHWKTRVFNGCRTSVGESGSIEFYYSTDRNEHVTLSKHFTAEEPKEFFEEGKGTYVRWIKHRKGNHHLDNAYNCCVAAHLSGVRLLKDRETPPAHAAADAAPGLTMPDGRPFSITDR